MIASSVAKSIARSVAQAVSSVGGGGVATPFVITPSTETPVAGVDVTWTTNAGDIGTPVSYSWDFGDGTIPVTGATPSHYFVGLGPYTVTCVVTYDDASTDTDTQTISPTAPAASPNMTLLEAIDFTADLSGASTGLWDEAESAPYALSVPVGAKLASDATVGYHGIVTTDVLALLWDVGNPNATEVFTQIGGWFLFETMPSSEIKLAFLRWGSQRHGWSVQANGDLSYSLGDGTVTVYTTVTPGVWFWLGFAVGPNDVFPNNLRAQFLYKTSQASSATVVHDAYVYHAGTAQTWLGLGNFTAYNPNNSGQTRFSRFTIHTLADIDDAAYPADIVQPQDEAMIWQVNPDTGDDSNDGVTAPIQTVTRLNYLLNETNGIREIYTAGVAGSGHHVVIDTSTERLDIGLTGLKLNRNGVWLKPVEGQTYIDVAAEVIIDAGNWTVTGGYSGIYETPCVSLYSMVWSDNVFHEAVASLAALDAASAGASYASGTVLYIKPFGSTDPRSDGKIYRHSRFRPEGGANVVGLPAVAVGAYDARVTGCKIGYTATHNGGSYAIGEVAGFGSKLIVEDCWVFYGDKHLICYTINTTDSEIITRNCLVEQSIGQALTSYMSAGTGNVHLYQNITIDKARLALRSSAGSVDLCWYSHGAYLAFASIEHRDCDYGLNSMTDEPIAALEKFTRVTVGAITTNNPVQIVDCVGLEKIPISTTSGGTIDGNTVVMPTTSVIHVTPITLGGTLSITDNSYDLRLANTTLPPSLWIPGTALQLTFTGNTIRFGSVAPYESIPLFKDMTSSQIVSCNNNTYYMEAAAIFAKNFDAGGGAADYTFAQWQALGYDADSTRLDPV